MATTFFAGSSNSTASRWTGHSTQNHLIYGVNNAKWYLFSVTGTNVLSCAYSTNLTTWNTSSDTITLAYDHGSEGRNFGFGYANLASTDVVHVASSYAISTTSMNARHIRLTLTSTGFSVTNAEAQVTTANINASGKAAGSCTGVTGGGAVVDTGSYLGTHGGYCTVVISSNNDSGTSWTAGFGTVATPSNPSVWSSGSGLANLASPNFMYIGHYPFTVAGTVDDVAYDKWATTWGASGSCLSAAVTETSAANVGFISRTTTDLHVVILANNASTFQHRRYDGSAWAAGQSVPTLTLAANSGIALGTDGSSVWMFAIDSSNNVKYIKWAPSAWDAGWTTLDAGGASARSYITCCQNAVNGLFGIAWTQVNGSNFDIVGTTLSTTSSGSAAGTSTASGVLAASGAMAGTAAGSSTASGGGASTRATTILAGSSNSAASAWTGRSTQNHLVYGTNNSKWYLLSLTSTNLLSCSYSSDFSTWATSGTTLTLAAAHNSEGRNFGFACKAIGAVDALHMASTYFVSTTSVQTQHARFALDATGFGTPTNAEAQLTSRNSSAAGTASGSVCVLDSANTPCDANSYFNSGSALGDQRMAIASNADTGTAWTAGFGTPAVSYNPTPKVTSFALADIGSTNLLCVCDNASTSGNFTQLEYSKFASAAWSAAATVLAGTVTETSATNWGMVARTTADVHVVALSNNSNTLVHRRFNGTDWTTLSGASIPNLTLAANSGLALSTDGTNIWMFAIDSSNNIQYIKWNGTAWDAGWTQLDSGVSTQSYITCCPNVANGYIGVAWTRANGSNFDTVGLALNTVAGQMAGSANGLATASGVLAATGAMAGTAAGVGTASGIDAATIAQAGAAAGIATASGTGTAIGLMAGAADGLATASGIDAATIAAFGSATGLAMASGVLIATGAMAGTAAGLATASGILDATADMAGSAAGDATASGYGWIIEETAGTASGIATTSAILNATGNMAGLADSSATATGEGSSELNIPGIVITASASVFSGRSWRTWSIRPHYTIELGSIVDLATAETGYAFADSTALAVEIASAETAGIASAYGGAIAEGAVDPSYGNLFNAGVFNAAFVMSRGTALASSTALGGGASIATLTGHGTANGIATVSGVLAATGKLAGTASGLATVSGVLAATGKLAGTASGIGTASGVLAATIAEPGTAAGLATASGVLAATIAEPGTAAGLATASGVLAAIGAMTGTAAGISTAIAVSPGSLPTTGTADGLAAVSGVLAATGLMAGTASGVSTASGTSPGTLTTTGTANGLATAAGVLIAAAETAGFAEALSTGLGVVAAKAETTGTSGGVSSASGFSPITQFAGTVVTASASPLAYRGYITRRATVSRIPPIIGLPYESVIFSGRGTATAVSTALGVLAATSSSTGTAAGISSATGIGPIPQYAGTVITASASPFAYRGYIARRAAASRIFTPSASSLDALILSTSGTANGLATASGVLAATGAMTGTAAGLATASGILAATGAMTGTAAGLATVSGVPAGTSITQGTASGDSTASGVLAATIAEPGTAVGIATASGVLAATGAMAGTAAGIATASGAEIGIFAITGTASGISAASGVLAATGAMTGTSAGSSTATAFGLGLSSGTMTGEAIGLGTATGVLVATGRMTGTASGIATASGILAATGAIAGSAAGIATASGAGQALRLTAGTAVGIATASGTIAATDATAGTAAGIATASGVLAATITASGSASGLGSASGVLVATIAEPGSAAGIATALGIGAATAKTAGTTQGNSTAVAVGMTSRVGAGEADGIATVSGVIEATGSGTGTAFGLGSALGVATILYNRQIFAKAWTSSAIAIPGDPYSGLMSIVNPIPNDPFSDLTSISVSIPGDPWGSTLLGSISLG